MKKKLILLCIVIISSFLGAQDLRMIGKAALEPLEKNVVTVKDRQGRTAAAIIIETEIGGFSFDTNKGIIKSDQLSPREIIIFVQEEEQFLLVRHKNYKGLDIDLNQAGISRLRGGDVWRIEITDADDKSGRVNITSNAENAEVFVNNVSRGNTPLDLVLEIGNYDISVTANNYHSEIKKIEIKPLDRQRHVFYLKPKFGSLVIETDPDKAELILSGRNYRQRNISPAFIEKIPSGQYELSISKEGYNTTTESITISDGEKTIFFNKLQISDEIKMGKIRKSYSIHRTLRTITGTFGFTALGFSGYQYYVALEKHKKYEDATGIENMITYKQDRDNALELSTKTAIAGGVLTILYFIENAKVKQLDKKYNLSFYFNPDTNVLSAKVAF
jgi:hypothetical protein